MEVTNRGKKNEVKAVVGVGKISLSSAITALKQQPLSVPAGPVGVEIPLSAPSTKKDQGKVLMRCELVAVPATAAAAATSAPASKAAPATPAAASPAASAVDSKQPAAVGAAASASAGAPVASKADALKSSSGESELKASLVPNKPPAVTKGPGDPQVSAVPVNAAPSSAPAAAGAAPSSYRLRISGLQAKELANTGGFLDKQDPALKITVGSESKETER